MIRLVRKEFEAWLRDNRGGIVGDPDDTGKCPLCNFLKSKGAKRVFMETGYRQVDNEITINSRWVKNFQHSAMAYKARMRVDGLRGGEALSSLWATLQAMPRPWSA